MNTTIFKKGRQYLEVVEVDNQAQIVGLNGWLDSIELVSLLMGNGYKLAR